MGRMDIKKTKILRLKKEIERIEKANQRAQKYDRKRHPLKGVDSNEENE